MNRQVLTAAVAALAFAAGGAAPASAEPGDLDVGALLAELRTRHRETSEAAEAYNAAEERLRDRRGEAAALDERLAAARTDLAVVRRAAGAVAREQYRRGGPRLPGHLRLLLGDDPARDLHAQAVAERAATAQAARIRRLLDGERRADELATRAREALDAEQSAAAERRRERDEAHRRLDEIAGLLAGLSPEQAAELGAREAARAERARPAPLPPPEQAPEHAPERAPEDEPGPGPDSGPDSVSGPELAPGTTPTPGPGPEPGPGEPAAGPAAADAAADSADGLGAEAGGG